MLNTKTSALILTTHHGRMVVKCVLLLNVVILWRAFFGTKVWEEQVMSTVLVAYFNSPRDRTPE
jgi:uncharacterized membrane protein YkvA (DUF1232 family)